MTGLRTKFYLDKQNRKWLGVCAGIARLACTGGGLVICA